MPTNLVNPVFDTQQSITTLLQVEKTMQALVSQSLGDVLGPMAQAHLETGGKRLRAQLAAMAAMAFDVAPPGAIAWGAACELAHNATLIHDDLQDGDTHRRGKPTTWKQYGMAQAINAGDWLLMLPYTAIAESKLEADACAAMSRAMAKQMSAVIEGQALECLMTQQGHVDAEAYEQMILGKTGALFKLAVLGAALASGQPWQTANTVSEPFARLGMMFQMQDDLLDLYGKKGRQEPGSDLKEGKISALVIEHIRLHPDDKAWLLELLQTPRDDTSQKRVEEAMARFRQHGAYRAVLDGIRQQASAAQSQTQSPLKDLMRGLIHKVLQPIAHLQ